MACAVFEDYLRTLWVEMGRGGWGGGRERERDRDTGVQWPLSCSYWTADQFQKYPLDFLPPIPTKQQSYDPWIKVSSSRNSDSGRSWYAHCFNS